MPSVMAAAMNSADASNSFSPFTLVKRELERIQISRGILQMRLSVMELGRFTAKGSGGEPGSTSIILFGLRERNGGIETELGMPAERLSPRRSRGEHRGNAVSLCVRRSESFDLFRGGGHFVRFRLLGDDHVLDLVVGGLGDDLLVHEIELGLVGPAIDDLLGVGVPDAGEFL